MTGRTPSRGDFALALPGSEDTIAAIATPAGRGALATLRVSGAAAHEIARRVLRPWPATTRAAALSALHDPASGALVDRAVAIVYDGPRSYTGEDMIELSVHGGAVVPALALSALVAAGARPALPGEFTRRAVANGKLDVLQAEGVADLIDARSRAMHEAALAQLGGTLSRQVSALREAVLEVEALVAYDIDFPEEDEGAVAPERLARATAELLGALDALLATAGTGEVVREGAAVVIAGPPNVGKSSLFNALAGSARAIVTDVPGTTRDALEVMIDVAGWPVRLVDTAGLRETADVVERLGIEVSERWLASAEVVLACGDSAESVADAVSRVAPRTTVPVVPVRTKADLVAPPYEIDLVLDSYQAGGGPVLQVLPVSAATGAGLGDLTRALGAILTATHGTRTPDAPILTRERHRLAVARAREEVAAFVAAWREAALPAPVAAVHLRSAAHALEELIGSVDVGDVLDRVFGSFCVGK